MKRTLIVIDMQNDFIDGSLGTPEAQAIVPNVKAKIQEYADRGDEIIFTRDTHQKNYLDTPEGRKLPVEHCIEGTHGWQIADGLMPEGCEVINKPSFGWTGWAGRTFKKVELVGLCTDICVVSNALILKAEYPEAEISVDASCCAGVTVETHQAALLTMKMCQVDVTATENVLVKKNLSGAVCSNFFDCYAAGFAGHDTEIACRGTPFCAGDSFCIFASAKTAAKTDLSLSAGVAFSAASFHRCYGF